MDGKKLNVLGYYLNGASLFGPDGRGVFVDKDPDGSGNSEECKQHLVNPIPVMTDKGIIILRKDPYEPKENENKENKEEENRLSVFTRLARNPYVRGSASVLLGLSIIGLGAIASLSGPAYGQSYSNQNISGLNWITGGLQISNTSHDNNSLAITNGHAGYDYSLVLDKSGNLIMDEGLAIDASKLEYGGSMLKAHISLERRLSDNKEQLMRLGIDALNYALKNASDKMIALDFTLGSQHSNKVNQTINKTLIGADLSLPLYSNYSSHSSRSIDFEGFFGMSYHDLNKSNKNIKGLGSLGGLFVIGYDNDSKSTQLDANLWLGNYDLISMLELIQHEKDGFDNALLYNIPRVKIKLVTTKRPRLEFAIFSGPRLNLYVPYLKTDQGNYLLGGVFGAYAGFVYMPSNSNNSIVNGEGRGRERLEARFDPYFGITGRLGEGYILIRLGFGPISNYNPKTRGLKLDLGYN